MGTELSPPEQRQRRSSRLQHCPCAGGLAAHGAGPRPHWFPVASQYVGRKDVGLEGKIIFFLYLLLVLSCCTVSHGANAGPLHPVHPG